MGAGCLASHLSVQNVLVINWLPKQLRSKPLDDPLGLPDVLNADACIESHINEPQDRCNYHCQLTLRLT